MRRDKQLLADGIVLERKTTMEFLRSDPQLHRAIEFELNRCIISPATDGQARDIAGLIADNLMGGEHWKGVSPASDLDLFKLEASR